MVITTTTTTLPQALAMASSSSSSYPPLLLLLLIAPALSAPLHNLISALPRQPPVSFKQYSGYITVDNAAAGRHLFYYFVEATHNPLSMPLTLWLNGGPGCSSIGGGAFTELGPFYPNDQGNGLILNSNSWNRASNMLFLETPAGVGFSYSNNSFDYVFDDKKVAHDNLAFLINWYKEFSEFRTSDLYLTGESYAGHYIPQLAALILKYNEGTGSLRLNLKGIAIGNPLLNYGLDTEATYTFLWSHGLISDSTYNGIKASCDFSNGFPSTSEDIAQGGCSFFVQQSSDEVGKSINLYDVTLDVCRPSIFRQQLRLQQLMSPTMAISEVDVCINDEIGTYLNLPEVQTTLHVTGLPHHWDACSGSVDYVFKDQLQDMLPVLSNLREQGLGIWIFSGDQDSVVPLTGTRRQIDTLAKQLNLSTSGSYRAWYTEKQVAGWTQIYENLTYATVRGAAHMVPYSQPARAVALFEAFLSNKPLPQE